MLVIELLEHISLELLVLPDRLQDLLTLLVRSGLDEIGDLSRMKPRQATRSEPQPRGRHVRDERLDLGPRHELGVLVLVAAEAPRQKTPDPSTKARVDPRNPPRPRLAHQLDLARPDQTCRRDVDHAAPQQIAAQQHLARPTLELRRDSASSSRSAPPPAPAARSGPPGTNSSRPPIRAFKPVTGGS